jgi:hypothetical protein
MAPLPSDSHMHRGFGTLLIVIILGGISLGLALWISTSSLWSIRGSIDDTASAQSKALVNACAEIALEQMRENTSFTGSGNQTIGSNTCSYTVTNTGGNNRSVSVTGAVGTITRKLQITTSAFNPLTIASWQEVP